MFTYNCAIDFTDVDLRLPEYLVNLGYHAVASTYQGHYLVSRVYESNPIFYLTDDIEDCILCDDINQFCKLAAIREDTDAHQLFIVDQGFVAKDVGFFLTGDEVMCTSKHFPKEIKAHKATKEEIIGY